MRMFLRAKNVGRFPRVTLALVNTVDACNILYVARLPKAAAKDLNKHVDAINANGGLTAGHPSGAKAMTAVVGAPIALGGAAAGGSYYYTKHRRNKAEKASKPQRSRTGL